MIKIINVKIKKILEDSSIFSSSNKLKENPKRTTVTDFDGVDVLLTPSRGTTKQELLQIETKEKNTRIVKKKNEKFP